MGPDKLQMLSQMIVFIGVLLVVLGSVGSMHFAKIASMEKENDRQKERIEMQEKVRGLIDENKDVRSTLKSFETLANKKYPEMTTPAALAKLYIETQDAMKQVQLTFFISSELLETKLPDNSYQYSFELHPEGNNIIPVFSVAIQTLDETRLNSLDVIGETIPKEFQEDKSDDRTAIKRVYRAVTPSIFKVVVHTSRKTQLRVGIYPLKNLSN